MFTTVTLVLAIIAGGLIVGDATAGGALLMGTWTASAAAAHAPKYREASSNPRLWGGLSARQCEEDDEDVMCRVGAGVGWVGARVGWVGARVGWAGDWEERMVTKKTVEYVRELEGTGRNDREILCFRRFRLRPLRPRDPSSLDYICSTSSMSILDREFQYP